jgi:heterodisulfide reductase subunit D
VARAAELEVDTLVSACPWSERPLSAAGSDQGIAVMDLFELVAEAAGIEVGGSTGAAAPIAQEGGR